MLDQIISPEDDEEDPDMAEKATGLSRIWEKTIETVITTVLAALVLGFFMLLWVDRTELKEKLSEASTKLKTLEQGASVVTDTLTREVAKIQAAEYEKRVRELERVTHEQQLGLVKLQSYLRRSPTDRGAPPEFDKIRPEPPPPAAIQPAAKFLEEEDRIKKSIIEQKKD